MRIRELLDYYADLGVRKTTTTTTSQELVLCDGVEPLPSLDTLERNKARPV